MKPLPRTVGMVWAAVVCLAMLVLPWVPSAHFFYPDLWPEWTLELVLVLDLSGMVVIGVSRCR